MAGMNVDGIVSGLDTTALVSQLMQLERQPQLRLTAKKTANNELADLYRQINSKLEAVRSASEALNLETDWRSAKATSSDETRVTVSAASTADPGNLTFKVLSLAAVRTVVSDGTVAGDAVFTGGFIVNGIQIDNVGTGTLADVAAAITASEAGVKATVIKVGPDSYRLQLAAKTTGPAGQIDVTGLDEGLLGFNTVLSEGSYAEIQVGTPPNGFTVTSETNTITDLLPGTTLTLVRADPDTDVTVNVTTDPEAIADKVGALVTAINDTLALIKKHSGYDANTKTAGKLLTNQTTAALSVDLARALTDPVADLAMTAEKLGIKVDRFGVATFDRDEFLAAYEADPELVERYFTGGAVGDTTDDGLAERLRVFTTAATSITSGPLNLAIQSLTNTNRTLDQQIESWDYRLSKREEALRRQFSAMEAALGQAQSMSAWLAGQIASLPGFNNI